MKFVIILHLLVKSLRNLSLRIVVSIINNYQRYTVEMKYGIRQITSIK